ncbi:TPA: hypothetical protein QDB07_001740 [Burkholderia vietnamiensis]|uniref:hypothetical protein n=1 Tax=Burkholderia vietnamiensis TaxID=60552 RepID=UPI00330E70C1|nr:hypothetical protein [Burkholderia vietnamiensis]
MKKLLALTGSQKVQRASIAYLAWTMPVVTLLALLYIVQQQAVIAEAAVRLVHADTPAAVGLLEASGRAKLLIASLVAATTVSAVAYTGSLMRKARA